jgi:hypothetical protein
MGVFVDLAIVNYRLSITDLLNNPPIFDCLLVPVTDYQLWQTTGTFPFTIISMVDCRINRWTDRLIGGQPDDRQTDKQADRQADRRTDTQIIGQTERQTNRSLTKKSYECIRKSTISNSSIFS